MNVKLVSLTSSLVEEKILSAEELIVYVARVSNPSNQLNSETSDKLIAYMVKNKHWSPFEMVDMTVEIITSRGIAQQILRHRSFSFQEFCISGKSNIKLCYPNSKKSKKVTIEDLYKRYKSSYWSRKGIIPHVRVYDERLKIFVSKEIKEVFKTGDKEVYELALDNGKKIKATTEHKFLTKKGFTKLSNIQVGNFIATNGVPIHQDKNWLMQAKQESFSRNGLNYIAEKAGVSYHTIRKWLKTHDLCFTKQEVSLYTKAWNKGLETSLQPRYGKINSLSVREKMRESSRKGSDSNLYTGSIVSWRKQVSNECVKHKYFLAERQGIDFKDLSSYEVDHILPIYSHPELALDVDNLQLLKSDIHKLKSIDEFKRSMETIRYSRVVSVTYIGKEMTYDLEVNHESHNYVANGIVTHNSQRYAEVTDFEPIQLRKSGTTNRQSSSEVFDPKLNPHQKASEVLSIHLENCETIYKKLLDAGVAKECARFVLPLTTQTKIYMKGSVRSWLTYLNIRLDTHTQLEHRQIAVEITDIFTAQFPNITRALNNFNNNNGMFI